ncbi:MAG: class I SAM-dependent methyltransferase [Elusimicrobia bacterium]|nr:class I SAM-dependent methyltransferase [Candidatus Obscuribacterium magneticum]
MKREAENCEPSSFSNKIHEYDRSEGKMVLDVGCGNGYVLAQYARYGARVFGIDLTEKALQLSQRRFQLSQFKAEFKLTDGKIIPYTDNAFDVICCMGVLHHIANPRPMINEINRVLKSNGQAIFMVYNRASFRNHITFRIRKYIGPKIYRGKDMQQIRNMNDGPDCPLAMVYGKREIERLLKDGFQNLSFLINKLPYEELFIHPTLGYYMARLLPTPSESFFARKWGWNLYVKGNKK